MILTNSKPKSYTAIDITKEAQQKKKIRNKKIKYGKCKNN